MFILAAQTCRNEHRCFIQNCNIWGGSFTQFHQLKTLQQKEGCTPLVYFLYINCTYVMDIRPWNVIRSWAKWIWLSNLIYIYNTLVPFCPVFSFRGSLIVAELQTRPHHVSDNGPPAEGHLGQAVDRQIPATAAHHLADEAQHGEGAGARGRERVLDQPALHEPGTRAWPQYWEAQAGVGEHPRGTLCRQVSWAQTPRGPPGPPQHHKDMVQLETLLLCSLIRDCWEVMDMDYLCLIFVKKKMCFTVFFVLNYI